MSVIQKLVHRTRAAASTVRAAHFVALAVISLALVAGFGVGLSLRRNRRDVEAAAP